MKSKGKTLYFIAGPNGAGKTTASMKIPSPEMAIERVKRRVMEGGHNIPKDVIRRRYRAGIKNLFGKYIAVVDSWQLRSNADSESLFIAFGNSEGTIVKDKKLFESIRMYATIK